MFVQQKINKNKREKVPVKYVPQTEVCSVRAVAPAHFNENTTLE
jgi:hypothetical protein